MTITLVRSDVASLGIVKLVSRVPFGFCHPFIVSAAFEHFLANSGMFSASQVSLRLSKVLLHVSSLRICACSASVEFAFFLSSFNSNSVFRFSITWSSSSDSLSKSWVFFLFTVVFIIRDLLGGLSRICFFLHSRRLGLVQVESVGATGDALGAVAGFGACLDRADLVPEGVLEGVGYPGDPPEVGVLCTGELLVTRVEVHEVFVLFISTTTLSVSILSSGSEYSVFSDTIFSS